MTVLRPVSLGTWPSPLEPAPRLAEAIGLRADDLWLKRDDLGGLAGGGNKVRKLEWTLAAAVRDGADVVVTSGAAQSNHARLTAAAGTRLGLDVVLVLGGSPPSASSGNLALDALLGARLSWAGDVDDAGLDGAVAAEAVRLRESGRSPAVVAFGGSTPGSTTGYATCAREILGQGPRPDHVVTALGSGGTMAGLLRGFDAHTVLGVHCGAVVDPHEVVRGLLRPVDPMRADGALRIDVERVGAGYEHLGPGVLDALRLAARHEGVVLDPTYTGRAMAGLVAAVESGEIRPGERTVFVHTGGLPGLFGHDELLASL